MSEFNVGDKVRVVALSSPDLIWAIGITGRITSVDHKGFGPYQIDAPQMGLWSFRTENLELIKESNMSKFYRVIKDLPAWDAGAILKKNENENYKTISDLWDTEASEKCTDYYESAKIVENSPVWFERVYEVSVLGKAKYLAKADAKVAHEDLHKPKR